MESVLVVGVVVVDVLGDIRRGRARRDEYLVQARRPRLDRQRYLADIAADDGVDLVLVDRALEGAHRVGGGGVVVIGDDLDLVALDAALGVDLVRRELRRLRDRGAGDRRILANDADLDCGFRGLGGGGKSKPANRGRQRCGKLTSNMRRLSSNCRLGNELRAHP